MKDLLEQHIARIERKVELLKGFSSKISGVRLFLFLLTILFAITTSELLPTLIYAGVFIGLIIAFLVAVDRHRKVEQFIEKLGFLKQIKKEQIARLELDWDEISFNELNRDKFASHPYAYDLNIIGKKSLFQLMDTSIYDGSAAILTKWLLNRPENKEEIVERQHLINELAPLQIFRDKMKVESMFVKKHKGTSEWSMEEMLVWLRLPKKTGFKLPIFALLILSVLNITLGILALLGQVSGLFVMISFISYITVYKLNSHKVIGLYDAAFQMEKLLGQFGSILNHAEQFKVRKGKRLGDFLKVYQEEADKPSKSLRKVRKFATAASLQKNQVLGPIVNLLLPWDLYFSLRLEGLKEFIEPKLTKWLESFYELEALNSMANYSFLNSDYSFPTFNDDPDTLFNAEELGHPLILDEQKVTNDFQVVPGKSLFLITGSNMAGKSTFLRTVGINLVLAYSGAPVNAESLNTCLFRIFTSINVNDSLGDGLSHFYAEVKRLRALLDELNKETELPLFFLVDEIYKGTNNRERYAGSAAFLKNVAEKKGIGMVSTHDLELADLESEIKKLSNLHFIESIENGKMIFNYKLNTGPCRSTNALKIMEMEGLPFK